MINPHHHAGLHGDSPVEYSYISGNLCLQTENTSTCFSHPISHIDIHREIPNVDGELTLFPSFLSHWTLPNLSHNPRITIAFDIIKEEVFNMIDNTNCRLINKENI
jgi:hypothetical protein